MAEYKVLISPRAYQDLDAIYCYLLRISCDNKTAEAVTDQIESAILSLDKMPYRGSKRSTGRFSDGTYRQLLAGRYVIIYRINEQLRNVLIIAVISNAADI